LPAPGDGPAASYRRGEEPRRSPGIEARRRRTLFAAWLALVPAACPGDEAPAADTPDARFDLLDLRVDGNRVLDLETVERAVYPFLGPGKTVADVEQARAALEQAYHKAGYETVFVDIPEQEVAGGMVVLKVTEAEVGRLRVSGSRYFALSKIRDKVPALAAGRVPHLPTVQAQLSELARQSPDLKVTPVIRAGKTPGRLEVDLQVEDRLPVHGSVELNSRSSIDTAYTRLSASIRYDNLWQRFHSASLQYFVSPQNADEVQVWSGTYAFPTGIADSRVALYGVGIDSATGVSAVGALDVVGSGNIFGFRYVQPLPSGPGFWNSATLGLDYKNFGQSLQLVGSGSVDSPVRYLPFAAEYEAVRQGEASRTALRLGLHFSVRGLGNDPEEFANRRYLAEANYVYLAGLAEHDQALPFGLSLGLRLSGQAASGPLIANEQFAGGGPAGDARVRGYHQVELLGDDAVAGSFELRSPSWNYGDWVRQFRMLAFAEGASLWTLEALPDQPSVSYLAGTGLGMRVEFWNHVAGELDWGYPLVSTPNVRAGDSRVDFRLAYEM
jgi:hemolysin activation/secretion protein